MKQEKIPQQPLMPEHAPHTGSDHHIKSKSLQRFADLAKARAEQLKRQKMRRDEYNYRLPEE